MIDKLTQQELEQWAIWNARNKFCFGKTQWHPEQILRGYWFSSGVSEIERSTSVEWWALSVVGALSSTCSAV